MKVYSFDNFSIRGSAQIPHIGKERYIGIAPSSEIDMCRVGHLVLAPCSVLPFPVDGKIEAVRPPRLLPAIISGAVNNIEGRPGNGPQFAGPNRLDVVVFEDCETPIVGPRAPWLGAGILAGANMGTTVATAKRLLRIPFYGRRQCAIHVRRFNDTVSDTNIVIHGVKYLARELIPDSGTALNDAMWIDEIVDTVFAGGATQPTSVLTAGTDAFTAEQLEQSFPLGRTIYVGGGGDQQEVYEELEVFVYGPAGAASTFVVAQAEAFGERVL